MSSKHGAGAAIKCLQQSKEPKPMVGKAPKQVITNRVTKPIHKKLSPAVMTEDY